MPFCQKTVLLSHVPAEGKVLSRQEAACLLSCCYSNPTSKAMSFYRPQAKPDLCCDSHSLKGLCAHAQVFPVWERVPF